MSGVKSLKICRFVKVKKKKIKIMPIIFESNFKNTFLKKLFENKINTANKKLHNRVSTLDVRISVFVNNCG